MIAQFGGRSDPQITMDLQYTADGFLNAGDHTTDSYVELSDAAKAARDPDERAAALQAMEGEVVEQAFTDPARPRLQHQRLQRPGAGLQPARRRRDGLPQHVRQRLTRLLPGTGRPAHRSSVTGRPGRVRAVASPQLRPISPIRVGEIATGASICSGRMAELFRVEGLWAAPIEARASPAARRRSRSCGGSTWPSAPARCTPSWAPTAPARARSRRTLMGSPEYEVTAGHDHVPRRRRHRLAGRRAGQGRHVPGLPVPAGDPRRLGDPVPAPGAVGPQGHRPVGARAAPRHDGVDEAPRHGLARSSTATSTRASPAARRSATRSCRWPSSSRSWRSSTRPTPASTSTPCASSPRASARSAPTARRWASC